jgi:hypothetical protein
MKKHYVIAENVNTVMLMTQVSMTMTIMLALDVMVQGVLGARSN